VAGILGLACLVAVLVLGLPVLWVGLRNFDLQPSETLDAESAMRSSMLQLLGGCLLLAGLVLTARTLTLTREGHITDRYGAAIEQLGSDAIDVRIGGIFGLERIAFDSPADRSTVVEVLTAYVRNHTSTAARQPKSDRIGADAQAALTVLGRRPGANAETRRLDLTHCGLTGADLSGKFDRANFHYSVLNHAIFTGGSFVGAGLSFTKGETVGFNNVDAHGAHFVHASFVKSWFIDSDLTETDFYGCDLTLTDMGRRYPESEAPAPASRLDNARFSDAILAGTNLGGSDLSTVRGLTPDQLAQASTDRNTRPPQTWGEPDAE